MSDDSDAGCDCGGEHRHGCGAEHRVAEDHRGHGKGEEHAQGDHAHGDPEEGPTDPRVHPAASPGFGETPEGLADIEVSRDVTLGEASPRELQATDVAPVASDPPEAKLADLEGGDPVERRRAALALGEEAPTPGVLDALAEHAIEDDDADVRQFAVEALGELGGDSGTGDRTTSVGATDRASVAERAARVAVRGLDDPNPWVRAEAVVALDRIDRLEYETRLEAALNDDHHAVRRNAAVSLFKVRGPDMLETLLDLSRDDSERMREWAAHMLAGVDDERVDARLRALASDEAEPRVVRSTAARSLEADPGTFRRQFTGGLENDARQLPGESRLNRMPEL